MIFTVEKGCFGYRQDRMVLRDIRLRLEAGRILAVLGPNGVGKTTLLRCMMGMLNWNDGASYLDGRDIRMLSERELWRKIAYVPQGKGISFAYTVEEMVLLGRSPHIGMLSRPGKADREKALAALAAVGMLYARDKYCSRISGGELQMVLIARALCAEPEMLVLDEPESNLDFRNQLIVLETMERLARERGISCIFNTHYPAHALKTADRALILSASGESLFGPAEAVVNEENLRSVFQVNVHIGDIAVDQYRGRSVVALSLA